MLQLTSEQTKVVEQVLAKEVMYSKLDLEPALDFFMRLYIHPIQKHVDISKTVLLDCGCGIGLLSHAYILAGGKYAVAADFSAKRVRTAIELSEALGIRDKIDYLQCSADALPFSDKSVDMFACIETLEHIGQNRYQGVSEINRATKELVLVTTPNQWFPVVSHDTSLPLAHWMPSFLRAIYAKMFKRQNRNFNNLFLNPSKLNAGLKDFKRISHVLNFDNFEDWVQIHPYYLPYGGKWRKGKGVWVSLEQGGFWQVKYHYLRLLSKIGTNSNYLTHNLAGIYIKKDIA